MNKVKSPFSIFFLIIFFGLSATYVKSGYACIYFQCGVVRCTKTDCSSNYWYGQRTGIGSGVTCCSDECCRSGYYECNREGCCCPVGGGCTSTTCYNCSVSCPPDYPNSSCDTSGGGTCSSTTRSCTKLDNCDDPCGTRTITCYSNPTCSTGCKSGGTYYSSAPSVSTEITSIKKYTRSNCTTINRCYTCRAGCGSCSGGAYSATQPSDTYIPSECTYTRTNCTTTQRNCYYDCPEVTCADLPSELGQGAWLDQCPVGQTCNETTRSVPIPRPTNPAPMGGKPYNCDTEDTKTCYYPNNRPDLLSLNIEAVPNDPLDSILGFSSTTHSGRGIDEGLNNPVSIEATYYDDDGSDDIMALYVWFSTDEINKTFLTPTKLEDLTRQTQNNSNFGILIARSYDTGDWEKVYVPHIESGNSSWVEAGDIGDNATIYGSTPEEMVGIYDIEITENGNNVNLDMRMGFLDETNDIVNTEIYSLWGSVNDKAGYLPFPDYPDANEIVDSADEYWVDPGNDWNLDMVEPESTINSTIVDSEYKQITITISASDDDRLSYVRLDACKNGHDSGEPLTRISDGTTYNLSNCDPDSLYYTIDNITTGDSLLGDAGNSPVGPFDEDEFVIGLGDNSEGSLTFYLTAMDVAGNNNYDSQYSETYLLEQWAVVQDGLVFGQHGVNSNSRTLLGTAWDGHLILDSLIDPLIDPFIELKADLTNQVLLGGINTEYLEHNLKLLAKAREATGNKSFKAMNYPGLLINSVYAELTEAYENKASNTAFEEYPLESDTILGTGTLSAPNGTQLCSLQYCIWTWTPDNPTDILTIQSGFECDGKGLIIANGDVTLAPNFTNTDSEDACIILSNGNITITDGDVGVGSPVAYDTIEAFLIADGYIQIPGGGGATPDDEGLFVQGGLVGFTADTYGSSVYNTREIIFGNMGTYPVLVVQGNSKYGLLSRTLFGSQVDIFKSEVGFKPY